MNTGRAKEPFWFGCSSSVGLRSFGESCWTLRSVEMRTEGVVKDETGTQLGASWVLCRPVML